MLEKKKWFRLQVPKCESSFFLLVHNLALLKYRAYVGCSRYLPYHPYLPNPPNVIQPLRGQRHAEPTRQRLIRRHGRRTSCRTQQYHVRNTDIPGIIPKRPAHRQGRPVVRECNHRRRSLRDRYPIIEIQGPGRRPVKPGRHDEVEIELAQCGRRVRDVGTEWDDGAAFEVHGDLGEVGVDGDGGSAAAQGLISEKVIELVVGEINGDTCGALVRHGRDEDGGAIKVL